MIEKYIKIIKEYGFKLKGTENHDEIINIYKELKERYFIREKNYKVIFTDEFLAKFPMLTKHQKEAIYDIKERFENNMSIKPYLSNYLYLNKFSKEDDLLIKHKIYHLHLNCAGKREKIVKRTNKLLYITYHEENVYFLKVDKHFFAEEWNDNEVINIKMKYIKGK